MDQKKIGSFLKELRKEKRLTQEQLAEKFNIAGRTVSRWETGNNMPDLSMLIELADFYDVDIREIIDGERKSENMDAEMRDTLEKVAEYTDSEKEQIIKKMYTNNLVAFASLFGVYAIFVSTDLPTYFIGIQVGCILLALLSVGESILYATGKKSAMTKNGNKLIGKIACKIYWPLLISVLLVILVFAVAAYARMVG